MSLVRLPEEISEPFICVLLDVLLSNILQPLLPLFRLLHAIGCPLGHHDPRRRV